MSKSVKATAAIVASQDQQQSQETTKVNNVYIKVITFDPEGKEVGFRLVDMYHYGTRDWLQKHLWWALVHHGYCVETNIAEPKEVDEYLARAEQALQQKYAHPGARRRLA